MNEMTPEQVAAVQWCMGTARKLSKWHCRRHFMTAPIIDDDWCPHAGVDCVCDRRKGHTNRCRCWRCGREYPKGES
jgi:hypothetical protein